VCGTHSGIVQFDNRLLYNDDGELREHADTLEWWDHDGLKKHVSHWQVKCAGRADCHTYKCGSCWMDDLDNRELCQGDFHKQEATYKAGYWKPHVAFSKREKDAKLAQKLAQLQPFTAALPQECTGQLAYFGQT
jgi:hypothetical protein